MSKIVAIGGGEIKDQETLSIDRHILELTGKAQPRLLFLPTASNDAEGYWQTIQIIYGSKLGASTEVLRLTLNPTEYEIQSKILGADAVYVGGGDTHFMLKIWQKFGIYDLLRESAKKGTVLSGLSAGAICWFKYGSTDSIELNNPGISDYAIIKGLNLIDGIVSPHHIREPKRIDYLEKFVQELNITGVGLDDNVALEIHGNKFRIIASQPNSILTRVYIDQNGQTQQERFTPSKDYRDIKDLFQKITL